jgi:hypothetical protein
VSILDEFPAADDADVMDTSASVLEGTPDPCSVAEEVVEDHSVEPDCFSRAVRLFLEKDRMLIP